jgi:hypothetical protein
MGEIENSFRILIANLKRRDQLGDINKDGRIMLKLILNRIRGLGIYSSHPAQPPVRGCCDTLQSFRCICFIHVQSRLQKYSHKWAL